MSREKELVKNTFILGIGYVIPAIVSFLLLPLYTKYLTKAEYGTYDLITVLLSLVMPAITLQIKTSVFRFLIETRENLEEKSSLISTAYLFTAFISAFSILCLFLILNVNDFFTRVLICIYVFQEVIVDLSKQTARGLGILQKYVLSITINSVLTLIFSYILLSNFDMGLNGLLISLNSALAVTNIYSFMKLGLKNYISLKKFRVYCLKQMLAYSAPIVPNSISLWIVRLSDRLVVTFFLGIEANAVYSVANKIPSLLSQVTGVFNLSWQENASLAINDTDAANYYSEINQKIIDLLIGSTAILIACSPFLFKILVRGPYDEAYNQIPILIFGVFFSCLSSCYGSIYIALKRTKFIGITSVIGAVLNLLINILLVNKIGLYAASISTAISYCIIYFCRVVQLKKYIKIYLNKKRNIFSFCSLFFICLFYYLRSFHVFVIALALSCILFWLLNGTIIKNFIIKYKKGRNK